MYRKVNSKTYTMAAGHLFCDMNQGALPAILPFLILSYGFSYTAAAGLILAANIISSIFQPLIGLYSDKASKGWMVPLGLLLSGGGLAVIGFLSNYWLIFISVMISGLGIAIFHPEAAKVVHLTSGEHKATSMSVFSLGGTLGFALGPIVVTGSVLLWGLQGLLALIIPAIIMGLITMRPVNKPVTNNDGMPKKECTRPGEIKIDQWKPFSLLSIVLCVRSIVFYGLNTFIPLLWVSVFLQSGSSGNVLLSLFLLFGAMGTIMGGRIADTYGLVKLIRISFVLLVPILLLLSATDSPLLAGGFILLAGIFIFMPYSSMVVLGQKYLPNRLGLASGITLGVAVSAGGIFAPVLGRIADSYGIQTVLFVLFCISIISILFSYTLSVDKKPAVNSRSVTER
ncbi:MFS transporter [Alkalihalobacillus oceani]|uniref:MFS transporter n=1 Tax=Halalkalibacter oceani TaxID=1653776 RepID=UPI00203F2D63|nr:MFS transporter [Halalkalibacter oceani]MCM3763244.1 MFS transporter [Halalkalibacter oceani]